MIRQCSDTEISRPITDDAFSAEVFLAALGAAQLVFVPHSVVVILPVGRSSENAFFRRHIY